MKIIDFIPYGNVIRFLYGRNDCNDYWGDDWDDPGVNDLVYKRYVKGYIDVAFSGDYAVLVPDDNTYDRNGYLRKEDLKNRVAPCAVIVKHPSTDMYDWSNRLSTYDYTKYCGADSKDSIRIYFGDDISTLNHFTILKNCRFKVDSE